METKVQDSGAIGRWNASDKIDAHGLAQYSRQSDPGKIVNIPYDQLFTQRIKTVIYNNNRYYSVDRGEKYEMRSFVFLERPAVRDSLRSLLEYKVIDFLLTDIHRINREKTGGGGIPWCKFRAASTEFDAMTKRFAIKFKFGAFIQDSQQQKT
ncbi:hypothetical protein T265_04907 [Opisthorchis viverrini]|uniref:Uncharacterized protein n=1 Tax=Opisthorchis viverrini TaxID=6198 RepID=A0A074ZQZ8_OPIVI|nr:hypothetical protein T265_04907 [Opisthorchis viverrini]KER28232.1 hypothetical protein T265_04907 [Opisthorchis viverrini]